MPRSVEEILKALGELDKRVTAEYVARTPLYVMMTRVQSNEFHQLIRELCEAQVQLNEKKLV
jgi:hypothetical protein